MKRQRDLSKWPTQFEYPSPQDFLSSELQSGVHSIRIGQQFIDIYVENRNSEVTLVNFNAAVPSRIITVPVLLGHSLTKSTGINLVAVSDPTLAMGDVDLTVTWYLGNQETGKLPPVLAPLIQHALSSVKTKRTILFGASGGGYAAVLYGQFFPDSIVFGVNPRLDLGARPAAAIDKYLAAAHNSDASMEDAAGKEFLPGKLSNLYNKSLPFDLCIYQNLGDKNFLNHQLLPFATDLQNDPRLFTKVEWIRPGHVVPQGARLRHIVSCLSSGKSQEDAIINAGFTPTVLNSRDSNLAKRYAHLNTW
ncbi:MAG: hypothetical protein ACTIA3_04600 [Corynebacterium casei]|uniref:hypothetical protein n=1 Tax=Corynebacterium casei TaxID=160386 RepID=UPI003F91D682